MHKKEKIIGKNLPYNIEKLKPEFLTESMTEIYQEKWFDKFDEIKAEFLEQEK